MNSLLCWQLHASIDEFLNRYCHVDRFLLASVYELFFYSKFYRLLGTFIDILSLLDFCLLRQTFVNNFLLTNLHAFIAETDFSYHSLVDALLDLVKIRLFFLTNVCWIRVRFSDLVNCSVKICRKINTTFIRHMIFVLASIWELRSLSQ